MQTGKDLFSDPIKREERPSVCLSVENINYYLHPVAQSEKRQVWLAAHGINVLGRVALSDEGDVFATQWCRYLALCIVSLIADLITCRIWHEESPPYLHWILMPIRLDGRRILVVVLTSYFIFCVYVGLLFSCWIRKGICLHRCTLNLFCKNGVRLNIVECCYVPPLFSGHERQLWRKGRKRDPEQARGEWETGAEQNWGVPLKPPLQIREVGSADQSSLFYVAGARLWSPRVTYSTHFIKFTSVLIADQ